jgi:predicted membrane chloride channel (bestrophin family)
VVSEGQQLHFGILLFKIYFTTSWYLDFCTTFLLLKMAGKVWQQLKDTSRYHFKEICTQQRRCVAHSSHTAVVDLQLATKRRLRSLIKQKETNKENTQAIDRDPIHVLAPLIFFGP